MKKFAIIQYNQDSISETCVAIVVVVWRWHNNNYQMRVVFR